MTNKSIIQYWIGISRLKLLVIGFTQYVFGVGIYYYLGGKINLLTFFQGLFFVWFFQLGTTYLFAVFNRNHYPQDKQYWLFSTPITDIEIEDKLGKPQLVFLSIAMYGAGLLIFYQWVLLNIAINLLVGHLIILFLSIFILIVPPFSLMNSGFGELIVAFIIGIIIPSFAFVLHNHESHIMVMQASLPLFFVLLSCQIVFQFPNYKLDPLNYNQNILQRLGWENGLFWNENFLIISVVTLILSMIAGLPTRIGLPIFLSFPLSLTLIWLLRQMRNGGKPNWTLINNIALANYGIMSYLYIYSFWIL